MKDVAITRVSSLAALGLNVLSPLEQTHIMGGTNLTIDQQQQQQQQQQTVEEFLAI